LSEAPAFVYRTRGGYRIVLHLDQPHTIKNAADGFAWKALYRACASHLAERYGIVADPNCADWTRLFRLPHVTRDGVFVRRETLGDPALLKPWAYAPSPSTAEEPKPAKSQAQASREPGRLNTGGRFYVAAALKRELGAVENAHPGERNTRLNRAAFS